MRFNLPRLYALVMIWSMLCSQGCFDEARFERLIDSEDIMQSDERDMSVLLDNDQSTAEGTSGAENAGIMGGELSGGEVEGGEQIAGEIQAGSPLEDPAIIGIWRSEGSDVASLLREPPLSLSSLEARFDKNERFVVNITNTNGESFSLNGQFSVPMGASLGQTHPITLVQELPESSTSEGIWRVEGDLLTYEVVQTNPPLPGDNSPPSTTQGFGSTNRGELGSDNIQLYRRVR